VHGKRGRTHSLVRESLGVLLGGRGVAPWTNYAIGRFGGRSLFDRIGKYVLLTHKDLDRAEAWFDRRGESLVFFGRFIPFVRSFISIAAGIAEMTFANSFVFTLVACAIWCGGLAGIGFALGSSWHRIVTDFDYVGPSSPDSLSLLLLRSPTAASIPTRARASAG
jgi:membrane protein DedA with SNARE-associated domain